MCVGQPFLHPPRAAACSQGRMEWACCRPCSRRGPRWSPPANWPPPCPHLVRAILYQPKNAWGAGSIQGEAFDPVGAVLSMYSLMHLVATTTTKDNVLPYILLPSPHRFPLGRCYLGEVWSPPSNVLLIRLVAPSSAFLFLFLAAIFSNELGSLFCKKFIRLSCIPFMPYFPIK